MYRPPYTDSHYFKSILDSIEKVHMEDRDMILIGDLNIDYKLNETLSNNPNHHIESLFNMLQVIEEDTRVTNTSSSLLDVILTNIPDRHNKSG